MFERESECEQEVLLCGTLFCFYCWFSLTQLSQSTLKEMPSILAVELCLCCPGRITVENICSGEPAMLIAGPVVRRQRTASCQKQHVSVLTMSCFQRERGGSANPRTECLKVLYFDFPCCPVEENAKAFNRLMWNMGRAPCVMVCAVHHEQTATS